MKSAGFDGPIMVECCKIGATPEETGANARANREFLERRSLRESRELHSQGAVTAGVFWPRLADLRSIAA